MRRGDFRRFHRASTAAALAPLTLLRRRARRRRRAAAGHDIYDEGRAPRIMRADALLLPMPMGFAR